MSSLRAALSALWRGALGTAMVLVCIASAAIGVAALSGYRPVVVTTGSMGQSAPPGALAVAGPTSDVEPGDVLVMRTEGRATVTHRVVDVETDDHGERMAITRGDANPDVDPEPYPLGDEELTVRWVAAGAGDVLLTIRSRAVGTSLTAVVVLAFVGIALRRIWREAGHPGCPDASAPESPTAPPPVRGAGRRRVLVGVSTALGVTAVGGGVALSVFTGVATVDNDFSTLECFDARVDGVQSGQLTSTTAGTTTVGIMAVVPDRSFLVFTASSASGDPDDSMILGRLVDPTTVEFVRSSDGAPPGDIVVEWSVVEYECGVSVQRGEAVGTGATQTDVPIAAVDPDASFVLVSSGTTAGASAFDGDDLLTAELVSGSTLRLASGTGIGVGTTHAWQVVTFVNGTDAHVQTITATLDPAELVENVSIPTPVDAEASMVLASIRTTNSGTSVGDRSVRAHLVDGGTVEVSRQLSAGSVTIVLQVVELRDGSTVERGTIDLAPAETTLTVTIPPVATTRSTALATVVAPAGTSGGSTDMAADDVAGEAAARLRLVDSRNVELTRDASAATASFGWQVVTWGGPSWADLTSPFRRRIEVAGGAVVTPTGYTTSLVVDHAAMVAAGLSLASGDDLRIWRHDGINWIELDRVLDGGSSWGAADTTVWFRTHEPLATNETVSYWLYHGNASPATPLDDPAGVWLVAEGFDDGTLGAFEDRTATAGWYRADAYSRRIPLTIPAGIVSGDVSDVQVLVRTTSTDVRDHARPDGRDIRFTAADGTTLLAHDLEDYDASSGTITAWVRVPTVTAASPSQLFVYFGAGDAPRQERPRDAWAGELAVWHLAADPGGPAPTLDDDGPRQLDGLALADAAPADTATGPAVALDGALDRLESAPTVLPSGPLTVAAWFRADVLTGRHVLATHGDPATAGGVFRLELDATIAPVVRFGLRLDGALVEVTGGSPSAATWHHVAATWDGGTMRVYLDGNLVGSQAAPGEGRVDGPAPIVIGADPAGGDAFSGALGQVRLDDAAWGGDRVELVAANLLAPAATVQPGATASGAWFDQGDWLVRRPVVVDADLTSTTLIDYPLLVHVGDAGLAARAAVDGRDVVFTADDGVTRLDHHVESWNAGTGELVAWVRVPTLDAATDTDLYLYLDNPTAVDQQDPTGVWGPDVDLIVQE